MELRDLPSVDELAREADGPLAVEAARAVIDRAREEIQTGTDPGDLAARLREELADARRPRLRRVLNATGVVVHTNRSASSPSSGKRTYTDGSVTSS